LSHIRKLPDAEVASRTLVPHAGAVSAGPTGCLEPRSESHYRLQLNTPERVKDKLELARDLMSHANPSGDLAVVVERGLDLLIAQLQKTRFGQTSRPTKQQPPRPRQPATADASSSQPACDGQDFDRSKSSPRSRARSHVSRETVRRLVERDGRCCSFVAADGTRCTARAFLEIDHRKPWARGGPNTIENLRWLCRALSQAERAFGKPHVQRAIAERGLRQATTAAAMSRRAG
jgi:hypothetical protein